MGMVFSSIEIETQKKYYQKFWRQKIQPIQDEINRSFPIGEGPVFFIHPQIFTCKSENRK